MGGRAPRIDDQTFAVREGDAISFQIVASDPDQKDTLTYSIVSGNEGGLFAIDPLTGIISRTDGGTFDYETDATSYTLVVQVTDDSKKALSTTATVTIDITDVNEAPTAIALSNLSVDENAAGAVVGAVTVTDPDDPTQPFGAHAFTVDDARFEIVGGQLKLKDGVALDHEAGDAVTVTVTATDGGGLSTGQTFAIAVTNVNEAPTAIALSGSTVDENAAGAMVGVVTVTDPDDPTQPSGTVTLSVDDARFEIVGGQMKLKDGVALDHEAGDSVTVTVTATDGGGLSMGQTFAIAVTDVNEAPTAIALSNLTVDENAAGAVVGTVTVADPDDPTQPSGAHAFTVDDARFEIVAGQLKLKDGVALDTEAGATATVTVTATDGGGLSTGQTFVIAVTDVNEAPTAITLSGTSVDENAAGAVIGAVTVADPDDPAQPFGAHAFTVDDARFEIVGGQLKLKDGVSLDHEAGETASLTVTATDGGGLSLSQSFAIAVNDLNEAPVLPAFYYPGVQENLPAGTVVGTYPATDPDAPTELFGTLTYSLVNDAAGLFAIDPTTGVIMTTAPLDFEGQYSHSLAVEVTDGGGLSTIGSVTVFVEDVRLAPAGLALSRDSVFEELTGATVGRIEVLGPETDPAEFYGLAVDDPRFEIVNGLLKLRPDAALDFETEPTVTLTLSAYDYATGAIVEETLTVNVVDVLEGRHAISLATLDGSNGVTLSSGVLDDLLGLSVSGAGDVNGDGFADVVVGGTSASYLVFGRADGWLSGLDLGLLDGTNGVRLEIASDLYGEVGSVASAGDLNGDGYDDLILGTAAIAASAGTGTGTGTGTGALPTEEAYVIFGSASGWSPSLDLGTLDGTNGFRLLIETTESLPQTFDSAGDVNGDGIDDLIISSPSDPAGLTYVLYGQTAGWAASLDLDLVTTSEPDQAFLIGESTGSAAFGFAVAGIGDINGDGYDDVAVTDPYELAVSNDPYIYDTVASSATYVFFGSAAGWSPAIGTGTLDGNTGLRIYDSTDNSYDLYGTGAMAGNTGFGYSVSGAGDVNGDGIDDLIVGELHQEFAGSIVSASAYVVFGRASGWPASLDVSTLDGTDGFRMESNGGFSYLGASVSSAGDVNGDGIDDLLVGDEFANVDGFESGAAYVVYGTDVGFDAVLNVTELTGLNGFRLEAADIYSATGFSVSGAGDVNGDGFDDLIVGAPFVGQLDATYNGEAYIVFGGDFTSAVTTVGTVADDLLSGTAGADSLIGAQGNDTLVGNGGADVLYGGAGNDILAVGDLSFDRIDGGGGTDTLRLDGAGQALDLTALGDTAVEGVERIDLTGSGDNALTLAVTDLLHISDESNDLFVAGDAGDQVTIVGDWQAGGPATVDGVTYNVYSVAGVEAALYVEDDVTVTAALTGV